MRETVLQLFSETLLRHSNKECAQQRWNDCPIIGVTTPAYHVGGVLDLPKMLVVTEKAEPCKRI